MSTLYLDTASQLHLLKKLTPKQRENVKVVKILNDYPEGVYDYTYLHLMKNLEEVIIENNVVVCNTNNIYHEKIVKISRFNKFIKDVVGWFGRGNRNSNEKTIDPYDIV